MSNTNIESIARTPSEGSFDPNPVASPNTCSKGPIAKSALTLIQKTIQEVGRQKSSLVTKIKATIKPIGTFLWKHFFCRLSNVLKRVGLFSSYKTKPSQPLVTHEASQETVPYEETKALSNTNMADLINTATSSKEPRFAFAQSKKETLCSIPEIARLKTPSVLKMPLKEKFHTKLDTIIEESSLGILLVSPSNEKQKITAKKFFNLASEVFGEDPIKRVQSWEKLQLPETFQQGDFLHVLAAIGHAVTLNDLTYLLKRVREDKVDLKLSSKEQDVSKLPSEDIKKLVAFFRNPLPHLTGEARVLWEELKPDQRPINSKRVAYTKYEYYIDQLEKEVENLTSKEKKLLPLASSEQLAKFVGYAKPDTLCEGMIIPVFTKHNIEYYTLKNHISTEGLHCCLFTPLNKDLSPPAQLIFRGTDGINSIKRDLLDPNGIGKTVFDKCAPEIAKIVNSYCESTTSPALEISGHSLGAADSQRATALCVELFNTPSSLVDLCNESFEAIPRLSRISCSAFCSPKLDAPTVELWETEIEKLSNSQLKLELNFAYHASDLVTWAGYRNLYIPDAITKNKNLQATYLHIDSDSNYLSTNTHHREPFFKGAKFNSSIDNRRYTLYNNKKLVELKAKHAELQQAISNNHRIEDDEDSLLSSFIVMNNTPTCAEQDITESMVMLEPIRPPKEELEEEAAYKELCSLLGKKEKIDFAQHGFSSEDSWIVFMLEKLLIQPTKRTFSYFN